MVSGDRLFHRLWTNGEEFEGYEGVVVGAGDDWGAGQHISHVAAARNSV